MLVAKEEAGDEEEGEEDEPLARDMAVEPSPRAAEGEEEYAHEDVVEAHPKGVAECPQPMADEGEADDEQGGMEAESVDAERGTLVDEMHDDVGGAEGEEKPQGWVAPEVAVLPEVFPSQGFVVWGKLAWEEEEEGEEDG